MAWPWVRNGMGQERIGTKWLETDDKIVNIISFLYMYIVHKLPMGEHAPSLQQEEIYINSSGSLLVRRPTVFARRDQLLFSGEQA